VSLADWFNRYIVEVRPAEAKAPAPKAPAPSPTAPGAKAPGLAPTQKKVADLLPPADPAAGGADPEIDALLAQVAGRAPKAAAPPAAPAYAPPPWSAAAPSGAPAPAASVAPVPVAAPGDPLDDGGDPPVKIDQVYLVAKLGKPSHGFTLERIATMLADPRLASLDERARAGAVAVLLEGAGVSIEKVIEDAATRDQALDKFERFLEEKVEKLEGEVLAENARLAEEIDRLIARKREEAQKNEARVLEKRRDLARFRRVKQAEEARLFDIVRPFTSDNPVTLSAPPPPAAAPAAPAAAEPTLSDLADLSAADTGVYKAQPRVAQQPPMSAYEAAAAKLRKDREKP
jgi:hypothetical protein